MDKSLRVVDSCGSREIKVLEEGHGRTTARLFNGSFQTNEELHKHIRDSSKTMNLLPNSLMNVYFRYFQELRCESQEGIHVYSPMAKEDFFSDMVIICKYLKMLMERRVFQTNLLLI